MTKPDPQKAVAREDLCRFLAACYYEPSEAFSEERLFDSMLAAADVIHPELAAHARKLGEAFIAQEMQTLLVDYTRLFLGPMPALAKPYGSHWLESEITSEESMPAVLDLYQQGGFDLGEDFDDLPDHVAVELEFLYLLIFNRNEAQLGGDTEDSSATESLERQFLREHLGAWIGPFAEAVKGAAETAFYRELAELTRCFVRLEADSLTSD